MSAAAEPPLELAIRADLHEIRRASDWLDDNGANRGIPPAQRECLSICLNEVLANIVCHGGATVLVAPITIRLDIEDAANVRAACVTVTDAGRPFDPTTAPVRPRPASLAEAEPGGLGLVMLRSNAERLQYHYQQGRNQLRFCVSMGA